MKTPKPMSLTLRVLARLLSYPDDALREHLDELRQALRSEAALQPARAAEVEALIDDIGAQSAIDAEADYVQLFDSGRRTSLHLFEHVHGDSRDRGPAMIDLAQTFESAGLYLAEGEMPDHLPVVLEYASTQPPREARAFLAEMAHIFNVIFSALEQRRSRYASALGALIELAGEKCAPVQRARRRADRRELGRARSLRRLQFGRTVAARPAAADPHPTQDPRPHRRPRSAPMNSLIDLPAQLRLQRLPVHLPGGVLHGQPGALRPRPVHLEERFVAAAAGGAVALGQQPVPRRHPVPVLRAPVRATDAACGVRDLRHGVAEAAGGGGGRWRGRRAVLHRPDAAAAPAHLRSAHPPDQPPHRHCDPGHPVGAAGHRAVHLAGLAAPRGQPHHDDPAGELSARHCHLPPGCRPGHGHGTGTSRRTCCWA